MKKHLFIFSSFCLLILTSICLSSCFNNDDSIDSAEDIEGVWYCNRAGYNENLHGGDSRKPCTCTITENSIQFDSHSLPIGTLKENYSLTESSVHVVFNLETDSDLYDVTVNNNGTITIGSKTERVFAIQGTYKKIQ